MIYNILNEYALPRFIPFIVLLSVTLLHFISAADVHIGLRTWAVVLYVAQYGI